MSTSSRPSVCVELALESMASLPLPGLLFELQPLGKTSAQQGSAPNFQTPDKLSVHYKNPLSFYWLKNILFSQE